MSTDHGDWAGLLRTDGATVTTTAVSVGARCTAETSQPAA